MAEYGRHEEMPKKKKKKGLIVLVIILAVLLALAGVGYYYVNKIVNDPASLFNPRSLKDRLTGSPILQPFMELTDLVGDDEKLPGTGAEEQTVLDPENGVVNILLAGIDAFEDGSTTSGTEPHADVCMVIAVDFNKKEVNLITLPRDTLTTTPGYRGFYKLNGTFNVGGGMSDPKSGFEQVCRTAEQWLGGLSVPYYYGVDYQAVVDIVNTLGGIDYQVDQTFTDMKGHTYKKSDTTQHLDGDAVLGYLRIRKAADGRDRSRTARQRRMMVAIFNKLKSEGSLANIPSLVNSAASGIWTNTTLAQTASMVKFATDIDAEDIKTYVIDGSNKINYDWAFTYVYQQERIDLLNEVYGINAKPIGLCSETYEKFLHESGFTGLKHIRQAEKVLEYIHDAKGSAGKLTNEQTALYTEAYRAYDKLLDAYGSASAWQEEHWEKGGKNPELSSLREAESQVKEKITALAKAVECPEKLSWSVSGSSWYHDEDINQVVVDFR